MPDSMPLSLRISAVEWMEWSGRPSWDFEQTLKLVPLLPEAGVDILDVSSAGITPEQKIPADPRYQSDLAGIIRGFVHEHKIPLLIGTVGYITSPEIAMGLLQDGRVGKNVDDHSAAPTPQADLAFIGRQFLREPEFVLSSARKLGVRVQWPFQYEKANLSDA